MELWELAAREAIRETVARYAHLVDRGRIDELVDLFVEDGVLEAGTARPPRAGRPSVSSSWRPGSGWRRRPRGRSSGITSRTSRST